MTTALSTQTLTYDTATGRFRHAYSLTPPLPPPPPGPPPRLIDYGLKSPPPPPPPPLAPPPWYEALEQCVVRMCNRTIHTDSPYSHTTVTSLNVLWTS
jgi:hypothetical protein